MHQGSALSPLLFLIVVEVLCYLTMEVVVLVVIAKTEDFLIKRLTEWKDNLENRDLIVNMNKTKVMISGEWRKMAEGTLPVTFIITA